MKMTDKNPKFSAVNYEWDILGFVNGELFGKKSHKTVNYPL